MLSPSHGAGRGRHFWSINDQLLVNPASPRPEQHRRRSAGCGGPNTLRMNIISHPLRYLRTWEHFLLLPAVGSPHPSGQGTNPEQHGVLGRAKGNGFAQPAVKEQSEIMRKRRRGWRWWGAGWEEGVLFSRVCVLCVVFFYFIFFFRLHSPYLVGL